MTTIAWDGKTLAADKQATWNDVARATTKIRRAKNGELLGFSGSALMQEPWFDWVENGGDFPEPPKDCGGNMLRIHLDGSFTLYCGDKYGTTYDAGQTFAIGSGADFALAAMEMGKTAKQAVKLACKIDLNSGLGVDTLTL